MDTSVANVDACEQDPVDAHRSGGEDHPDTLRARNALAGLYRRAHRFAEAEAAYQAVLAGRARTLGELHPATLAAQEHLAAVRRRRWPATIR